MSICKDCKDINKYNDYLRKKSKWKEHPRFSDVYNEGDDYNCSNCRYNKDINMMLKRRRGKKCLNPIELKQIIRTWKINCMLLAVPFKLRKFFSKEQIKIIKRYKLG